MKRFNLLTLVILIMSVSTFSFGQTTYVDNGTSNTYTLQTGDSLYIKQGTFTGSINDWNNGGKVTVAAGATLKPANVNGFRSKYVIYGTAELASLNTEAGFGLNNFGTVTVNGGSQVNGNNAQTWINNTGATLTFKSSFAINANNTSFTNYGDITIASDFNVYANATVQNKKSIVIAGNFNSSKGDITNEGLFSSTQRITFSGSTNYTNTCRTVAENGIMIDNNSTKVYNSGLLWASNSKNTSSFTNSGTVYSTGRGVIKTVVFTNYKEITGNGFLYITGYSTLGGQGKVGTNGNTTDSIKIYTVNRTKTTQIFDDQWGTVYNNSKYAQFSAPDTTTASYYPCSVQYAPLIILPVVWNEFSVSLSADIPNLKWSAKYDAGTYFEVERSNNGVDFVSVTRIAGQQNVSTYNYDDRSLSSSHPSVVYYRIKATEPDGTHKYTDVKSVRFCTESNTSVQTWPNPFSSVLNINYKSAQKAVITIKIFNIDGQLRAVKTAAVNTGNNSITVSEANNLSKGIYIIKVVADNGVTSSSKIVKQ